MPKSIPTASFPFANGIMSSFSAETVTYHSPAFVFLIVQVFAFPSICPRFKKFVSSITYPQSNGFKVERKKVYLSKIGDINFVNHRQIEGKAKTCTIKKTKSGEWYLTVSAEKEDVIPFTNGKEAVGMDLGIGKYAVLSDNTVYQNAKRTKHQRNHAKVLQQGIARKRKA